MSRRKATRNRVGAPLSVMLVDDHPMWRATLRKVLAIDSIGDVVAEAATGATALERADECKPDIVIMDINLPEMDGVEATRRLLAVHPEMKVLVLASSNERAQVLAAVRAGASGYLLKTAEPDDVVDAVSRVHRGELVFPSELSGVVLDELRRGPLAPPSRILVASATLFEREGVTRLLEEAGFEVSAGMGDIDGLLSALDRERIDLVIVDEPLAGLGAGRSGVAAIRERDPNVCILVLSADPKASDAERLLSQGENAICYVLKERVSEPEEFIDVVRRVLDREPVVDPRVVRTLVEGPRHPGALDLLTPREREVLALMAEGHSNQAISERLFVLQKTVEAHVGNIFTKLGLEPAGDVHRRVLAVITYLRSR